MPLWSRSAAARAEGDIAEEQQAPARPPKASWRLEPGAPIAEGRYAVQNLGGGTRFEVYLAWDERLMAYAVAKILRPDQAQDERAIAELRRETDILSRLAHPVIVRKFDAVLDGPRPHVLIEHFEGPNLRRLLKMEERLPLEQILPVAMHVASALHYMSTQGITHLDVKPSNIVMGLPPRLIDLSLARTAEQCAALTSPTGTDAYMAPEQCAPSEHRGEIGPASDMWGLGVTIYHAVTGAIPFERAPDARYSADPYVRFPQLTAAPSPMPAGVPLQLADLVHRMLAYDTADRPAAAEAIDVLQPLVEQAMPRRKRSRRR